MDYILHHPGLLETSCWWSYHLAMVQLLSINDMMLLPKIIVTSTVITTNTLTLNIIMITTIITSSSSSIHLAA